MRCLTAVVTSLVGVAFGATYGPAWYRELPGALRSALQGDRTPLLRLVAEFAANFARAVQAV